MEIKIELEDWKCDDILLRYNYITEEVTAYYENNEAPYDNIAQGALYPINIKVAYPKYNRPKELDKEQPLLDVLKVYEYKKVVNDLFVSRLWDLFVED